MALPAAVASWVDPLFAARDRLISNAGFRRWVAALPVTRHVARRKSRALFDLVAGFVYSQVLRACVDLDLFALLYERPRTLAELSDRLDVPPEAMRRLLDAAVSLDLASHRSGGRYGLGELGAAMAGDGAIAALVAHHRLLYADLADPVALLRQKPDATRLSGYWAYAGAERPDALSDGDVAAYSSLMSASLPIVAAEILASYPFASHRRMLDVGGGEGAFVEAVAAAAPALDLMLFDLPAVAQRAEARLASLGLARVRAVGGDFKSDPLPEGADLVTLVRVLLDHDDASALLILRAARAAIAPGGTVLVAEPMSGVRGLEPIGDAYFGLYLFAMGRGRPRTVAAHGNLLTQAGFERVAQVRTHQPVLTSMLVARASDR